MGWKEVNASSMWMTWLVFSRTSSVNLGLDLFLLPPSSQLLLFLGLVKHLQCSELLAVSLGTILCEIHSMPALSNPPEHHISHGIFWSLSCFHCSGKTYYVTIFAPSLQETQNRDRERKTSIDLIPKDPQDFIAVDPEMRNVKAGSIFSHFSRELRSPFSDTRL